MYAQDHEEALPASETVRRDIKVEVKITQCPSVINITNITNITNNISNSYLYNPDLSGVFLGTILDPSTTWVTGDGIKDMIELRHGFKAVVSFLDGHVSSITELIAGLGAEKINPIDGAVMKKVPWMPLVPGGSFTMGSPYNVSCGTPPTQEVTLTGYWIYKYEVTVEQYLDFCSTTSRALPAFPTGYSWMGKSGWTDPTLQKHPIVNVSWFDCKAYADWAGVSLPTEAQWEYAARGPQEYNYPWGGIATVIDSLNGWDQNKCANYDNSSFVGKSTCQIGSFPKGGSWCGVQDMAGNVNEWCFDWYSANYSSTPVTNPIGPTSGTNRIVRSGSWGGDDHDICSANHYASNPTLVDFSYGFRCVMSSQ
jgi:prepilin-type processing-associated H-X9-DG protein